MKSRTQIAIYPFYYIARVPFSRRPTIRLPIESQTFTIWPWNDLDLYDFDLIYGLDLRKVKLS